MFEHREIQTRITCRWPGLLLMLAGLLLTGCNDDNDNNDSNEALTNTRDRPWIRESEFIFSNNLHATLNQILVLDLEPAAPGDASLRLNNDIPFQVTGNAQVAYCIPSNEPHITGLKVLSSTGETEYRVTPGSDCKAVTLSAGRYTLQVEHDASTIDPPGKQAFIRQTNATSVMEDSATTDTAWNFFTFKGPNGKYVSLSNPESDPGALSATAETVTADSVFLAGKLGLLGSSSCTPGSTSLAPYKNTPVAGLAWYPPISGGSLFPDDELLAINIDATATAVKDSCKEAGKNKFGACVVSFTIKDLGNHVINLLSTDNCVHQTGATPIYLDEFKVLKLDPSAFETGASGTAFKVDYTGYLCAGGICSATDLNLKSGEVAVFSECNFKGPAIVFAADVADFSVYNDAPTDKDKGFVYGIRDNAAASIIPGPGTLVELWTDTGSSSDNTVYGVPENVTCLSDTPVDGKVSQMKIVSVKQYITDTGGCDNCNLTGINLSDTDLGQKSFINATFNSANLNGTSFKNATLKNTDFSGSGTQLDGTDFSSASLECTNFSSTDLTMATFGANTIATDFSCRLDLASATLDYGTFPVADWRYFNLTSSTVNNVPATLSSNTAPLDLSGSMLGNVDWLKDAALDYANLGCYTGTGNGTTVCPAPGGDKVCATLTDTVLTGASLTNVCLEFAQLQGALLEFANLDKADLSEAKLLARTHGTAATLEGAFMRDVSIENADLTGVAMINTNFYKGQSAADASGATLTNANLSGAYLAGANFSDAVQRGTTWSKSELVAINFNGADLSADTISSSSNFDGAYIEGAVFDNATVTGADFTNTYWDPGTTSRNLNYLMPVDNLRFTGYWNSLANDECVQAAYTPGASGPPQTDSSNTCPDGSRGPCNDTQWTSPLVPFSGAGSQTKAAIDPDFPGSCTTADILWTF